MTDRHAELSVGQLAQRSGVSVSTLHFYEAKGLIRSHRTGGNQRRYGRDVLRRIAIIRAAQRVGLPLAAIADSLARLPQARTPTRKDWSQLSRAWRDELDDRIASWLAANARPRMSSTAAGTPPASATPRPAPAVESPTQKRAAAPPRPAKPQPTAATRPQDDAPPAWDANAVTSPAPGTTDIAVPLRRKP